MNRFHKTQEGTVRLAALPTTNQSAKAEKQVEML